MTKNPPRVVVRAMFAAMSMAIGLCAMPNTGRADFMVDGSRYCSAGSNPGRASDTSPGSLLSLEDVSLMTVSSAPSYRHASDCYGAFDSGNSSPANEVQAINEIFGPGFSFLDKTGGASNLAELGGFKWEIHELGGSDGMPGLWTITWTALDPTAWIELPLTVDLAVLLMGGNQSAVYLLKGVFIPAGPAFGIGRSISSLPTAAPNANRGTKRASVATVALRRRTKVRVRTKTSASCSNRRSRISRWPDGFHPRSRCRNPPPRPYSVRAFCQCSRSVAASGSRW